MASTQELGRMRAYLDGVREYRVQNNDDLVLPIIGGEGVGKSTLMLQMVWIWQELRGEDPTPDSVFNRMVWGEREEFKQALLDSEVGEAIAVQDAAHVLYAKEAMVGEQVEIEKALLDMRIRNNLILLGFQDWSDMPDGLRRRRAENAIRVFKKREMRGFYEGYDRSALDEKYSDLAKNEWPEPFFSGRFPSLEGSTLWERFAEADVGKKEERLEESQEADPKDAKREVQVKTALRAVKPWSEEVGMTYREAAQLIDYSPGWVSDRVQEWREGQYSDLVEQLEPQNPEAAPGD